MNNNDTNKQSGQKLTLIEKLVKKTQSVKTTQLAEARSYIIVHSAELQQALEKGFSVKSIWDTLHDDGNIKCHYAVFCKLVKSLLVDRSKMPPTEALKSSDKKPPVKSHDPSKGFKYNPVADVEDLFK